MGAKHQANVCEGKQCSAEKDYPRCRSCFHRAAYVRADKRPVCCRGCEFADADGCEIFGGKEVGQRDK